MTSNCPSPTGPLGRRGERRAPSTGQGWGPSRPDGCTPMVRGHSVMVRGPRGQRGAGLGLQTPRGSVFNATVAARLSPTMAGPAWASSLRVLPLPGLSGWNPRPAPPWEPTAPRAEGSLLTYGPAVPGGVLGGPRTTPPRGSRVSVSQAEPRLWAPGGPGMTHLPAGPGGASESPGGNAGASSPWSCFRRTGRPSGSLRVPRARTDLQAGRAGAAGEGSHTEPPAPIEVPHSGGAHPVRETHTGEQALPA